MTTTPRKRFYKAASVTDDNGIALDGRPVRTPMKQPLRLPTRALAEAIAKEWDGQGDTINPSAMILTKLANTAIDRVADDQQRIADEIVKFAGTDQVSYRAHEPEGLVTRQAEHWNPVIDWAMAHLDAPFVTTTGIVHREQPAEALGAFGRHVQRLDPWTLTALHNLATITGSALIAAMLAEGALDREAAWRAAFVDEDWEAEHWGQDEEAVQRRGALRREFDACADFLELARQKQ
ncbi:MAG: ATP12 family protein [Hyphomicrobiales bacterium]